VDARNHRTVELIDLAAVTRTITPQSRIRLAPALVVYADDTGSRGARSALRILAPGSPLHDLAGIVGLAETTGADHSVFTLRARFAGDETPNRLEDVRHTLVAARERLWHRGIDVDLRQIDVHLLLAPDTRANFEAAATAYTRARDWVERDDDFGGVYRLTTWFAPGFAAEAQYTERLAGAYTLPPTRGAALLTLDQRAEVIESVVLDLITSSVSRHASLPRPAPFLAAPRPLAVFHRSVTAGNLEKRAYAVGSFAAYAVGRLERGLSLADQGTASTQDPSSALEQSLQERRSTAAQSVESLADELAAELVRGLHPALFRRLLPNDRAVAAETARERFTGPASIPGSRAKYAETLLAAANVELAREGPQSWAERLSAGPGGVGLATDVLQTALKLLPASRFFPEPVIELDNRVFAAFANGVVYTVPPWLAVLPWFGVLAGLMYLFLDMLVPTDGDLPWALSAGLASAVVVAGVALEILRRQTRRNLTDRTLGRPHRRVSAWAQAWRTWLVEVHVWEEQRRLLKTAFDNVVQRSAELTGLQNGLTTEAERALARAKGAGWNLCVGQADVWVDEVAELLGPTADDEIDRLWREAAGSDPGAFLVGTQSNCARVSELASRWATRHAENLSIATLENMSAREIYPRLHDGSEGSEWLTSLVIAPELSPIELEAVAAADAWLPRIDADRASVWVIYAD